MNSVSEILFVKYKLAIFGITEGKEKKKETYLLLQIKSKFFPQ